MLTYKLYSCSENENIHCPGIELIGIAISFVTSFGSPRISARMYSTISEVIYFRAYCAHIRVRRIPCKLSRLPHPLPTSHTHTNTHVFSESFLIRLLRLCSITTVCNAIHWKTSCPPCHTLHFTVKYVESAHTQTYTHAHECATVLGIAGEQRN